jgi:class 3 adenylate cyclase/tetratricopeptide (TPR) repeat protein
MFVDMVGSLAAIEGADPEEAHELLSSALSLMAQAVHTYGGVVLKTMGDGIMAIFGAPSAQEDHAVRACHSALHLLDREERRRIRPALDFRIGLHSGEVAVGGTPNDFTVDYDATGAAVHVASRVQHAALPGTATMTAATHALIRGEMLTTSLGPTSLRGLTEKLELFTLVEAVAGGHRAPRAPQEIFIGRAAALVELDAALRAALLGHGRFVGLVGEPGVGKTTLIDRFLFARSASFRMLKSSTGRYHGMAPFHPFREILLDLFGLAQLDVHRRPSAISDCVEALEETQRLYRSSLLDLFEVGEPAPELRALDPHARRALIGSAICQVLLEESKRQPLVIVIEDLHWADSATIELLGVLADATAAHRILLLVSFRSTFEHGWARRVAYRQIRLDRLDPEETGELIDRLLGEESSPQLRGRLLSWSQGNPLFLRESIRVLIDAGVLEGDVGARKLRSDPTRLAPPASIAAIIAERIDRLTGGAKQLLLAASVLGGQFLSHVLVRLAKIPPLEFASHLRELEHAEFISRVGGRRQPTLEFRHPLFREVCYATLLKRKRRQLHAASFAIEEAESPEQSAPIERLAYHAINGDLWREAATYCRAAGQRAASRSAHREAAAHFENAATALARIDPEGHHLEEAIDLRLELRAAYTPLFQLRKVGELLAEAHSLAQRLGDSKRLATISGFMAGHAYLTQSPQACKELCAQALKLSRFTADASLRIVPNIHLAQAYYALGRYRSAISVLERNLAIISGSAASGAWGLPARPLITSLYWIAISKAEIGLFSQARATARQMLTSGSDLSPFDLVYAHTAMGFVLMVLGDFEPALEISAEALEIADESDLPFMVAPLASQVGWLNAMCGNVTEGLKAARRAVQAADDIGSLAGRSRWWARLSEVCLLAGDLVEAGRHVEAAIHFAQTAEEQGYLCSALRLRGNILSQAGDDTASARRDLTRALALARSLAIGPTVAKCLLDLGALERRAGRASIARTKIGAASTAFHRYKMRHWERRARREAAMCG